MRTLTGTGSLIRLFLRLDRVRLTIWSLALGVIPVATANAFQELYATEASRLELAATVSSNPAFTALLGPLYDPSIGGLTAWRVGSLGTLLVGLMAVLTMIRHTRDDEETGRRELLGSTVVGRNAPLAAALAVTIGAGLVIGAIIAAGLTALGLDPGGSVAFGAGFAAVAMAFAAVGAYAAQATQAGSTGRGLGVGIVGLFFVFRMAGDASSGLEWLSWLSPIGWFTRMRPFAGERWWVFALWIGLAQALTALAIAVQSRRDVGEGAIPPRPGPERGKESLRSPSGLAWRLHRGSLVGWTIGLGVIGVVYGAAGDGIADLLEDSPQLAEVFEQMGGADTLTNTFFSAAVGIIALLAAAYSIRNILKLKSEEDALRSELVLATAISRGRYAGSHLLYGLAGPILTLAVAGALAGATYGAIVGDVAGETSRVLAAAMAHLPAVWVLTGAAMALYGLVPRLASLSWGLLAVFLILGQLGQILQFPQWSLNLSPFSHIPMIWGDQVPVMPFVILAAVSATLIAAGITGFYRRDIPYS